MLEWRFAYLPEGSNTRHFQLLGLLAEAHKSLRAYSVLQVSRLPPISSSSTLGLHFCHYHIYQRHHSHHAQFFIPSFIVQSSSNFPIRATTPPGARLVDMGLSMRVGVTALASLGALSSVVKAQGFYYQDIGVQCNARYNYQYLGCAATTSAPFAFAPTGWDPAATADNSRSYINFDIGDFVNMTITPYFCAQTCRAHGFKYAALWDKGCHCGSSLDYTTTGGANVTLSNLIDANSDTVCTTGADNNQWPPCGGDRRENCGSNRGARIFVDPSFPDERKLTDFAIIAQGYALLGCFKNARFPSAVDSVTSVSVQSTATCLQYCADLGMPYAYMARDANQGYV